MYDTTSYMIMIDVHMKLARCLTNGITIVFVVLAGPGPALGTHTRPKADHASNTAGRHKHCACANRWN